MKLFCKHEWEEPVVTRYEPGSSPNSNVGLVAIFELFTSKPYVQYGVKKCQKCGKSQELRRQASSEWRLKETEWTAMKEIKRERRKERIFENFLLAFLCSIPALAILGLYKLLEIIF